MLKQTNCVKHALNTAGLTLEADVGESFLVKGIYAGTITSKEYLTIKIDNFTVGYYRTFGKRGNELGGLRFGYDSINLMNLLVKRGLPFSFPIAEGQKLTLSALDGAGSLQVVYDIYDAGDIRSDMPNGTTAKSFGFIQYMYETDVLTATGDMLLNKTHTPAEFPDFPAGKDVPPKMTMKLHGIEGSPFADFTSSGNGVYSTFLKLIKEREVLLNEDNEGIPFLGDKTATTAAQYIQSESLIGSVGQVVLADTTTKIAEPYWFDPPIEFTSGEELNVYLTCEWLLTHTMTAELPDIGLILEVNRE